MSPVKLVAPRVQLPWSPFAKMVSGAKQWYIFYNGTNAQINCGSGASLDNLPSTTPFTVDFHLRVNPGYVGGEAIVIGKRFGWYISIINAATAPEIRVFIDYATTDILASISIVKGLWTHIAVTYNEAGDRKARIYKNGILSLTSAASVGAYVGDAAGNFFIGDNSWTGSPYKGDIGWVRVSNSIRWSNSFAKLSRVLIPILDGDTNSLWPMNTGTGTTADDIGANNNNGTISNGVWRRA